MPPAAGGGKRSPWVVVGAGVALVSLVVLIVVLATKEKEKEPRDDAGVTTTIDSTPDSTDEPDTTESTTEVTLTPASGDEEERAIVALQDGPLGLDQTKAECVAASVSISPDAVVALEDAVGSSALFVPDPTAAATVAVGLVDCLGPTIVGQSVLQGLENSGADPTYTSCIRSNVLYGLTDDEMYVVVATALDPSTTNPFLLYEGDCAAA